MRSFSLLLMVFAFGHVVAKEAQPEEPELPEGMKDLIEKAIESAQSGNIEEAVDFAQKALLIKDHYTPHHLLSQLYLAAADHEKSLDEMQKAFELEPSSAVLKSGLDFHKAIVEQMAGNFPEAMKLLKSSEEAMTVLDVKSIEKIAIAAAAMGDITYSVKMLKELWEMAPAYSFHNNLPMVRVVERYENFLKQAREEGGADGEAAAKRELSNITKVTDTVYMDLSIGGKKAGRIVFGLYGLASPKAVKNMVEMVKCTQKTHCYKGTSFHRVIASFIVQGGDVANGDGSGVRNIYDRPMADEVFGLVLMHDRPGVLQMANAGPHSNGGQFVILCATAPHLNGAHVIMGTVLKGMPLVYRANTVKVDQQHRPVDDEEIVVTDCGVGEGPNDEFAV